MRVPPKRNDNSSPVNVIVASSPGSGHRKWPRSKRLKYSQNPSPSHSRIFTRFRLRLQNTNNAPSNGSSSKIPSTIVAKPLIDLRISVFPQARYTRFPDKFNMAAQAPAIGLLSLRLDMRFRRLFCIRPFPHIWNSTQWFPVASFPSV